MSFDPNRIYLTGFMGVGKTTVGSILARLLDYDFVDADALFQARTGMSVEAYFKRFGESLFRQIESGLLYSLGKKTRQVVALGGGIVLKKENRDFLGKRGRWVYLQAEAMTLSERLRGEGGGGRPLLAGCSGMALNDRIESLLKERGPYYKEAQYPVVTDGKTAEQVAGEVYRILTFEASDAGCNLSE